MKYLICENYKLKGWGNQLRAIIGWYFLAKVLDRQFVINNTLFNYLFDTNHAKQNFKFSPRDVSFINIQDDKHWYSRDFRKTQEKYLIAGGGDPMIFDLAQHKIFGGMIKKYKQDNGFSLRHEDNMKEVCAKIINKFNPVFRIRDLEGNKNKDSDYKYRCLQFRVFAHFRFSKIENVDKCINYYTAYIKEGGARLLDTYIMSDSPDLNVYVNHRLSKTFPNHNFYNEKIYSRHLQDFHSGHIVDSKIDFTQSVGLWNKIEKDRNLLYRHTMGWLTLAHSQAVLSTGTSFAESACYTSNKELIKIQ